MKAWTTDFRTHNALGTTTLATCIKATRRDGVIVATTSHDESFPVDAVTYLSSAGYSPSDIVAGSDMSPDNLEIEGFLASPLITADDVKSGLWDYARIEMFQVNYNNVSLGRNMLRAGTLGEVRAGNTMFVAELRGLLQSFSRRIVQLVTRECRHDLGDARCQVNLASFTVTGTVTSVSSNGDFHDTSRTETTEYFTAGKVTWLTGLNAGLSMEVKQSTSAGVIVLQERMPFDIEVGDTYSVYAGCTKRFEEDCITKFNNAVNFGGFPHLPGQRIYRRGGVS